MRPLLWCGMKYGTLRIAVLSYRGAAGIIKDMGRGLLVALGVHPELSPIHPRLPQSFAAFDKDRMAILDIIRDKILSHLIRQKKSHSAGLLCRTPMQ